MSVLSVPKNPRFCYSNLLGCQILEALEQPDRIASNHGLEYKPWSNRPKQTMKHAFYMAARHRSNAFSHFKTGMVEHRVTQCYVHSYPFDQHVQWSTNYYFAFHCHFLTMFLTLVKVIAIVHLSSG